MAALGGRANNPRAALRVVVKARNNLRAFRKAQFHLKQMGQQMERTSQTFANKTELMRAGLLGFMGALEKTRAILLNVRTAAMKLYMALVALNSVATAAYATFEQKMAEVNTKFK